MVMKRALGEDKKYVWYDVEKTEAKQVGTHVITSGVKPKEEPIVKLFTKAKK